ncbi:hypothetical protein CVS40_5586 [Lucilia cuprina]|nr:hypothetical protein CVS40_5586 [Lucilia cuprina]
MSEFIGKFFKVKHYHQHMLFSYFFSVFSSIQCRSRMPLSALGPATNTRYANKIAINLVAT